MELIIKPTGRCNFNCTFCSASCLNIQHPSDKKVPEVLKGYIKELKPDGLIITGGEPLMVDPEYYYELREIANCSISATSNLKDFYLHPEKWVKLFKENWFNIATSFNYGNGRMWDKNTVYTEEMFIKVLEKYKEYTGRKIESFIAVIDENNEDIYMDHVLLAKRLGMVVKLNNAIAVGSQDKTYPKYKMYQMYLNIIDAGLEEYEANCMDRTVSRCPRNITVSCEDTIRCCYVDLQNKLHVSICDEQLSWGNDLSPENYCASNHSYHAPTDCINDECYYCNLCRLCNGCKTNKEESKKDPNYCEEMKKLEPRLIETGWLL